MEEERKSKVVAGLLGIFLGSLGIHNFYLGYKNKAIWQVALTGGSIVLGTIIVIVSIPLTLIVIDAFTMFIGYALYFIPLGVQLWGLVE
ncbi:MAG: TM2 domain-containing protein [Lachnospiraceae bacterium]|nr:TM2 domain-containing protein [Lachnospiraceae bacterium]